jgi:hypothetical protein
MQKTKINTALAIVVIAYAVVLVAGFGGNTSNPGSPSSKNSIG